MIKDTKLHIAHLQGTVNNKMVDYLTDILNAHTSDSESEVVKIIFDSNGGKTSAANKIIYLLNSHPKEIILVGAGHIASAAFDILIKTGRKKELLPNTTAMYHLATIETTINSKGNFATDSDKFNVEIVKCLNQDTVAVFKRANLTESEIEQIFEGKDVYFNEKRLIEIVSQL